MGQGVEIQTVASHFNLALAANTTNSSFAASLASGTKPVTTTSRCLIDRGIGPNFTTLAISPFAVGADDVTGSVKVLGWTRTVHNGDVANALWVPNFVAEVLCTFSSTLVGIAGTDAPVAACFADVLSLTNGIAVLRQGTSDVDTASILLDISATQLYEIFLKVGTATSINAFWRAQ